MKRLTHGLCFCFFLTLLSAMPVVATAAIHKHCADKNSWQPQSYKASSMIWISNSERNGWYRIRQQQLYCKNTNDVCSLHHILGIRGVAVCQKNAQGSAACRVFAGTNNWDLNLARSYCSYRYQEINHVIGHGHGPSAGKVVGEVLGGIAGGMFGLDEAVNALGAAG